MLPDEPTEPEAPVEPETPPEAAEETPAKEEEAEAEEKPEGEETDPEGEPTEAEEAKKTAPPEAEGKRKRTGWQRQQQKLDRLERQNALLVEQLTSGRQGQPAPQGKPDAEKTPQEQAQEYMRAMTKQVIAEERQQQEQQRVESEWVRRSAEEQAKHEDFEDVVSYANIPAASPLGQTLLTSEHGPAIMYALAKSPAELARISALPPLAAAREVGRLEAKLAAVAPSARPNGSAKRPPAPPTSVHGSASSTRSLEDLPLSEYKRAMRSGRR